MESEASSNNVPDSIIEDDKPRQNVKVQPSKNSSPAEAKSPIFVKSNPDETLFVPKKDEGVLIQDYEPDVSRNDSPAIIVKGGKTHTKDGSILIETTEEKESPLKSGDKHNVVPAGELVSGGRRIINLKADHSIAEDNNPDITQKSIRVVNFANPVSKLSEKEAEIEEHKNSESQGNENITESKETIEKLPEEQKSPPHSIAQNIKIIEKLDLSHSPNKIPIPEERFSPPLGAIISPEPIKKGILNESYSESEIQEAFHTFDLNHDGGITGREIRAILHSMGEQATDDEIDEMVRMFDSTGRGKISYHDFFTKITGMEEMDRLPIELIEKESYEEYKSPREPQIEIRSRRKKPIAKAVTRIFSPRGITPSSSPRKTPEEIPELKNPKTNQQYIKNWVLEANITKRTLLDEFNVKLKNPVLQRSPMLSYKKMCSFFGCDDTELSRFLFALFGNKDTDTIDLRKCLAALSCLLFTSMKELLQFQFELFAEEESRYLTDDELLVLLQGNHFVPSPNDVLHKAKTIFAHSQKFMQDDTLSEEEFYRLGNEMPDLFFLTPVI